MRNTRKNSWLAWTAFAVAATTLVACVNQQEKSKRDIQQFMASAAGEYMSQDGGDTLMIAPVYARMVALDTLYVERTSGTGTQSRLIELAPGKDGKILQLGYSFTDKNQWRNVRENPELFTAMLPKDVRAAGTCDIKVSDDRNKITYSCGGSAPQDFVRMLHGAPN